MGGLDKLLETLRQRLAEQKGRHQGGKKWIGTGGTSPFGAYGYNPEGVRIGQDKNRNFRAVKVWDKREFRDLDGDVELGTRNIKVALRRLRKFARTGAPDELDLDGTIKGTAHKGYLDILMRPERHNTIKVLLFFDIGGSMDWHVKATEELFSAAQDRVQAHGASLLPQLPLRESVEGERAALDRDDADLGRAAHLSARLQGDLRRRRGDERLTRSWRRAARSSTSTRKPAQVWMERVAATYPSCVWLNPVAEHEWETTASIRLMRQLMGGRMYPLTLEGLDGGDAGVGEVDNLPSCQLLDCGLSRCRPKRIFRISAHALYCGHR